jgi:nucleotide-binding universal stress UspA family protein
MVHLPIVIAVEWEMLRVSFKSMKEKYAQVAIESREQMRAGIRNLQAEDIQVNYKLREGKPAKKIVKVAEKLGVDLIVRPRMAETTSRTWNRHHHGACRKPRSLPRVGDTP